LAVETGTNDYGFAIVAGTPGSGCDADGRSDSKAYQELVGEQSRGPLVCVGEDQTQAVASLTAGRAAVT
jgi:hypothetical protein